MAENKVKNANFGKADQVLRDKDIRREKIYINGSISKEIYTEFKYMVQNFTEYVCQNFKVLFEKL